MPKVINVAIDAIAVRTRKRQINGAKVAELAESIAETGLLQPIVVRDTGDVFILVAGHHRLEAFRFLGRSEIPASILECDEWEAELAEIDENLKRKDLDQLEMALHLKRREELLAEKGLRAKPHRPEKGAANAPLPKTTEAIGAEMGYGPRETQVKLQIGKNLDPETVEIVSGTPIANSRKDLLLLARIDEKEEQLAAAKDLVTGRSKPERPAPKPKMESEADPRIASEIDALDFLSRRLVKDAEALREKAEALCSYVDKAGAERAADLLWSTVQKLNNTLKAPAANLQRKHSAKLEAGRF